jgi:L-ascorbate metabolism protein UlaG (beta-lactamase superfamily)
MPTSLKYLGISAFQIEAEGHIMLVDPCITMNESSPVKVEDMEEGIDIILVTHGAPDHMGDAVEIQKRTKATLVSGPGVRVHAIRQGVREDEALSTHLILPIRRHLHLRPATQLHHQPRKGRQNIQSR